MDCKILYTNSYSGAVCHPNCVQWSNDNRLAICFEKRVYILSNMSNIHIPFESDTPLVMHTQVISEPEETLSFDVKVNKELLNSKLQMDDLHGVMLDHTLSPRTGNAPLFLTFKCARWSPVSVIDDGCSCLAVLTMDHRLVLYREVKQNWIPLIDLSVKFYNLHEEIWEKDKLQENAETRDQLFMLQQMKERTYKLAAIDMTWTQKFSSVSTSTTDENMNFSFLIVAMKSSHIIFWKVVSAEMIEVAAEWDSKLGYISSLCWQQTHHKSGILILGANSGRIVLLPVWITSERGELQFGENVTIWKDEDLISVSQIVVLKRSQSNYIVVATKDVYLISCEVIVRDKDIIIKKVGYTQGLHSLSATGLCRVGHDFPHTQLALTSYDGRTVSLVVKVTDQRVIIDQVEIFVDVERDKMAPVGVCCSQNGILYGSLYNIPVMYDCHATKEPLKLVIFTMTSVEIVARKLLKKTDISIVNSSTCSQFSQLSDYLDSLHAHFTLGVPLPSHLENLITYQDKMLEKKRPIRLQLMRHVAKILLATLLPTDRQYNQIKDKLETIECLIMRHHIVSIIGKFQSKLSELTDRQRQSLLLMNDWLLKKYHMVVTGIYQALGQTVPTSVDSIPIREKCRICREVIPIDNIQFGICSKSHKFGRCCKSLLICDMASYKKCKSCKILNLSPAVWLPDVFCTFCNNILWEF